MISSSYYMLGGGGDKNAIMHWFKTFSYALILSRVCKSLICIQYSVVKKYHIVSHNYSFLIDFFLQFFRWESIGGF